MKQFFLGQDHLTAGLALEMARGACKPVFSAHARESVRKSQEVVERIVRQGDPVYGINTGFGPLCTTRISAEQTKALQVNLLKSHSVGVGQPVDTEIARLMLVLKLHALAKGHSGISEAVLDRLLWHLEVDAIPIVPSQGSLGASGDLAPLAHLFLPLIGLGKVRYKGEEITTETLFEQTGLEALEMGPKEGLALINGTQFIAAHAVKVVEGLHRCLSQADVIAAMMIEGLQGSIKPFLDELHQVRPYKGNQHVAGRIRALLQDSEIMDDHSNCERVQDPYSLRCIPQVHGASRHAWLHLKETLEVEINSVTDNPVIFNENLTISGGNFHGQPLALPIDYACLAAAELGNISDRRVYLSLEGNFPGVPKLLMNDTGTNSGYMILQYTTAALVSENKGLCFPASADSIPSSLGQEDHVSMGAYAGRKALQVVENLEKILAIEWLTAAQAMEFRKPLRSGVIMEEIHQLLRKQVPFANEDRVFAHDIEQAIAMLKQQVILTCAAEVADRTEISLRTPFDTDFEIF